MPGRPRTRCGSRPSCSTGASSRAVTVVAPTEHLKTQWADAAARVGIHLNPAFSNSSGLQSHEYDGVALTYAQVASKPALHRRRTEDTPTLVILDEIHHGGDARSWGDGIRDAFDPAARRLSLTGTPFRSDTTPIPFVRYEMGQDGILRSASDYSYGYAAALRDGVVRPVLFLAYGGAMRWRTKAGDEVAARLGEPLTKDQTAQAWRTALDPKGEWVPSVLAAADTRLSEVRRHVPDAGGLVICSNRTSARAYAKILRSITGEAPTVVLSDDAGASAGSNASPPTPPGGWSPCGWCPRASTCRGLRRRLRDVHVDPVVLRPGRRPLRACPAGGDGIRLPALGAGDPQQYATEPRK